jgi:hypothetical protein
VYQVCTAVECDVETLRQTLLTLLVFEALVCAAHGFPGMGDLLFGYGEEEWWNEVAERGEQ